MPTVKRRPPPPKEWAKRHPARNGGPMCWICARPAVAAVVAQCQRDGLNGEQTRAYLVEFYAYPFSASGVWRHMREHLRREKP